MGVEDVHQHGIYILHHAASTQQHHPCIKSFQIVFDGQHMHR